MKQISKKERFYLDLGEAMFMNNMRGFINTETLKVEIYPEADYFFDEEDTAQEAIDNPDKYVAIEQLPPWESFKIMEAFTEAVEDKGLQLRLVQALERKKPFANFKNIIDNSSVRQNWFEFRDEAHPVMAKQWIEENASDELKEKIKLLPTVFKVE